ncbi:hypothetical protein [Rhodophyticola porphyridii]|uniref:Chromosome partitioning protein ParB n=1 Tax=Rhodophyticola porphyridii TaxID=1852017 RepID=A0A3L9YB84_9RHOB|nr:hypothetical protein [Rhodophyticola porphyridii]RMA43226.1 hypothetical protein D9R08_06305 [Rhodophyticola porphyridii]
MAEPPETPALRAQYHIRQGATGSEIWDVRKLVRLAKTLPVLDVPLAEIGELDEVYWYGGGDLPTVRSIASHARLMAEADLAWPILLSAEGRVMDGMHRVAKAAMAGEETIRARRFPVTPPADYRDRDLDDLPYD